MDRERESGALMKPATVTTIIAVAALVVAVYAAVAVPRLPSSAYFFTTGRTVLQVIGPFQNEDSCRTTAEQGRERGGTVSAC